MPYFYLQNLSIIISVPVIIRNSCIIFLNERLGGVGGKHDVLGLDGGGGGGG